MNVLIIGSGGREHALAWGIHKSKDCGRLFVAPGNAGTASIAENLPVGVNDFEAIARTILEKKIELLVVGPEDPLVRGLRDHLESREDLKGLKIVGCGQAGAQLEGSKDFSKQFMGKYGIPTAAYQTFTAEELPEAYAFLETLNAPYVLKADGLAAGKGVLIIENLEEARDSLKTMLDGQFGEASKRVVIEEFLTGIELSVFVLTDGQDYVILPEAKDYKRIGEHDTGPNTGGMGAVSPVPFADQEFMNRVETRIIQPTLEGLRSEGIPYIGFIFIGLMNVSGDPYVIEYNVRMGDPETQVVIPRISSDLLHLLTAAASRQLGTSEIALNPEYATTVVMVSGGYPGSYEKGLPIQGLEEKSPAIVFHAGTKPENGKILTNGGRVLALTGMAPSLREALGLSYDTAEQIEWDGAYYRRDIGKDLQTP